MSRKLTQEEFELQISEKYNNEFSVVGNYINAKTPVKIRHNICNTEFSKIPNGINTKNSTCNCPNCSENYGGVIIVGINDLWTKKPEIAKLLLNSEDGYKYSVCSQEYVDFVCPNCNKIINKKILNVTKNNNLSCHFCSDGISYPNKFMAHLLLSCGIDFIPEYKIGDFLLDFYFEINKIKYAIEMDGGIGHGNKTYKGLNDVKGKENDLAKNRLCISNNIHLLRIDCNYVDINKRFDYIVNSIKNSNINKIIDISNVDYVAIDKECYKSIVCEIAKYWNKGIHSYDKLSNIFHINRPAIRKYLRQAININLIDIDYDKLLKEIRLESNKKIVKSKGYKILCEQTDEIFDSIASAKRMYHASEIHRFLKGLCDYAGHLDDGTKLTWKLI